MDYSDCRISKRIDCGDYGIGRDTVIMRDY